MMSYGPRLGDLLIQRGLVSQDVINEALRIQIGGNRRLGRILVRMGAISEDSLAERIAEKMEIPLCDISCEFSPEARKILPRYLCRRYNVLPLRLKANNVLKVAMADPFDNDAINDLEGFTGKVIEPILARSSDIDIEIPRRIPIGLKDFFNPQSEKRLIKANIIILFALVISLSMSTYILFSSQKYGTVSIENQTITYKNHDLMVSAEKKEILLLGRPAYAPDYIKFKFDTIEAYSKFMEDGKFLFSGEQYNWLQWIVTNPRFQRVVAYSEKN